MGYLKVSGTGVTNWLAVIPRNPCFYLLMKNCNHEKEGLSAQNAYTKNTKYANAKVTNLEWKRRKFN